MMMTPKDIAKKNFQIVNEIDRLCNKVPDFITQWDQVNSAYEALNFKDNISDKDMIKERKYINSQYKRAVNTKSKDILGKLDEPSLLVEMLNKWIDTEVSEPKDGFTRKFIVYVLLYKRWLKSIKKRVIILNKNNELLSKNNEEE